MFKKAIINRKFIAVFKNRKFEHQWVRRWNKNMKYLYWSDSGYIVCGWSVFIGSYTCIAGYVDTELRQSYSMMILVFCRVGECSWGVGKVSWVWYLLEAINNIKKYWELLSASAKLRIFENFSNSTEFGILPSSIHLVSRCNVLPLYRIKI